MGLINHLTGRTRRPAHAADVPLKRKRLEGKLRHQRGRLNRCRRELSDIWTEYRASEDKGQKRHLKAHIRKWEAERKDAMKEARALQKALDALRRGA